MKYSSYGGKAAKRPGVKKLLGNKYLYPMPSRSLKRKKVGVGGGTGRKEWGELKKAVIQRLLYCAGMGRSSL